MSASQALPADNSVNEPIIKEGWVLKKRRKKMQGFARRYFVLYQTGLLSYSLERGQPSRDQVFLPQAAISTASGRKDIHIDSNTVTFHIKCLSTADFNQWMAAFRTFKAPESRKSSRFSPVLPNVGVPSNYVRYNLLLEEMGNTLNELDNAFQVAQADFAQKKPRSASRGKSEKEKHSKEGGYVFGMFKKPGPSHNYEFESSTEETQADPQTSGTLATFAERRVQVAIELLRTQHATLSQSLLAMSTTESGILTTLGTPLPSTAEEDDNESDLPPTRFSTPVTRVSKRTSIATSLGESVNDWFDAPDNFSDGALEFFLDVNDQTPCEEISSSHIMYNNSRSSLDDEEGSKDSDSDEKEDAKNSRIEPTQVTRRTRLPTGPVGDEGSLFAILKKNVGKDLSTIAFPVTFNEPLTLLQRSAEEAEYYDLLNQASVTEDPILRMCFVAAFAVSGYAHTRHRSGRKGFNPMLGETFEDPRMMFISEKVCHHPLVIAYHAQGEGWELDATSSGRTKFWGKSLEIIPLGTTHVKIGKDHYQWKKPSSFMRNLMMGTKYLEHSGKLEIRNTSTNARCVLDFKQNGYWAASNIVSGVVYSPSGETETSLEGKWDEQLAQTLDSDHLRVLWRAAPYLKNSQDYYGFTSFGITLNEMSEDVVGKLPLTDSRNRPDVRALEDGDLDLAEAEKLRVEEAQRDRRKRGAEREPRWFKEVGEDWVYQGGYWEERSRGWNHEKAESLW